MITKPFAPEMGVQPFVIMSRPTHNGDMTRVTVRLRRLWASITRWRRRPRPWPEAGVREPRRPRPTLPAGAIALAEPRMETLRGVRLRGIFHRRDT